MRYRKSIKFNFENQVILDFKQGNDLPIRDTARKELNDDGILCDIENFTVVNFYDRSRLKNLWYILKLFILFDQKANGLYRITKIKNWIKDKLRIN